MCVFWVLNDARTIVAFVILPKTFRQNFFLNLQEKMYLVNQFAGCFLIFNMLRTV